MSIVLCATCSHEWNASSSPLCDRCEFRRLMAAPHLISDKHDPRRLPLSGAFYRSCLSHDFVDHANEFIEYAAASGSWFYSTAHETWNLFTPEPLGRIPGWGIYPGDATPDHALNGLLIADVLADPHAFAVDDARVRQQIRDGELVSLSRCPRGDCGNLCVPGAEACAMHATPPLAYPVG